jgi:hypothetical protein
MLNRPVLGAPRGPLRSCPVSCLNLVAVGERGKRARKNELVLGPEARVVDVDVEETIGSGPRTISTMRALLSPT